LGVEVAGLFASKLCSYRCRTQDLLALCKQGCVFGREEPGDIDTNNMAIPAPHLLKLPAQQLLDDP
jgi:hypothetical protein